MNINKRLIVTNTVTVLIPLIITIITAYAFIFISSVFFNENVSYDNFKNLVMIRSELFDTTRSIVKQNPEIVEQAEFQKYLSQRLSSLNGRSIITKGDNVLFNSVNANKIDVANCTQELKTQKLKKSVKINNNFYMVDGTEIKFKDGTSGNVIFLIPSENNDVIFERFLITVVITFIISFIAVNMFMSYMLSKRILKPISLLKDAAANISSGNLDSEIIEDGDQEIRELCQSFEVMRIQLKDSIDSKIQYDDNRRMLISSISHDLKTPITSIEGYVEGILDGIAKTPEKMESYLKTIYSKAKYMDVMIDDLLLYSKLELNQIPFNFEKVDIIEYLNFCIYECAPELEKSNISISLNNDLKYSKYVMLDRERMKRVILNIIDNSRKYMDKAQGEISLMLRETNLCIIIEISDNGSGIDKNQTYKIFDRFYRTDSARSGAKGSGLGLAIAKQIVEGHGGRIWCISHENEGTSIMISLTKIMGDL